MIDGTIPTQAELEYPPIEVTTDTIKVRAKGADTISGIYMYTFQKSTTNSTSGFGDSESYQTNSGTREHTYTGLQPDTTYYLRVIISDHATNEKISNVLTVKTDTAIEAPVITILNNNTWCNTTKTAQIQGVAGYTIRYTTDGSNPSSTTGIALTGTGTQSITLSTEQCVVKAIYVRNNNTSKVTGVGVSDKAKIDKTPPTINKESETASGKSNVSSWKAQDSLSGINKIEWQESGASNWNLGSNGNGYTSCIAAITVTFNEISFTPQSKTIVVRATDIAGNVSSLSEAQVQTSATEIFSQTMTDETFDPNKTANVYAGHSGWTSWQIFSVDCPGIFAIATYNIVSGREDQFRWFHIRESTTSEPIIRGYARGTAHGASGRFIPMATWNGGIINFKGKDFKIVYGGGSYDKIVVKSTTDSMEDMSTSLSQDAGVGVPGTYGHIIDKRSTWYFCNLGNGGNTLPLDMKNFCYDVLEYIFGK